MVQVDGDVSIFLIIQFSCTNLLSSLHTMRRFQKEIEGF